MISRARRFLEPTVVMGIIAFVVWRWLIGLDLAHVQAHLPTSVRLADGTSWHLFDPAAKFTILDFGASWCAPCRWEEPMIANFLKHRPAARLKFIDEQEASAAAVAFAAQFGLTTPVLDDGTLASALSVWKYPAVVIIRPDGSVAATFSGYDPAIGFALMRFAR